MLAKPHCCQIYTEEGGLLSNFIKSHKQCFVWCGINIPLEICKL